MKEWFNYPSHILHFGPARSAAEPWRLITGLVAATALYFLLTQLYATFLLLTIGPFPGAADEVKLGSTPLELLVLLVSFIFIPMALAIVIRLLHKRTLASVMGPLGLLVPQFVVVLILVTLMLVIVALLPPWDMGGPLVPNLPFLLWLSLLPFGLLAVLIQVSAEEILFRGYIQQQLAARFSSPLVWMVLPSILFALGHYAPASAGSNALYIALWAGVFGLLMADLTARAGSLGPAIAVHLANNVMAMLITSMPGELSGLALFHAPFGMEDETALRAWLPVDFAMMIVTWLAARLALRR